MRATYGSTFTVAMRKAFDETVQSNDTIGGLISKPRTIRMASTGGASGSQSLSDEKMKP